MNLSNGGLDQLKQLILDRHPKAVSLLLVGSSLIHRDIPPSDIDIIVLSPDAGEGDLVDDECDFNGQSVDLSIYHPLHFLALSTNPELAFFHMREIRKFVNGKVFFDLGIANQSILALSELRPPTALLARLWVETREAWKAVPKDKYSADFFCCLESAIFLRMHITLQTTFSKHKYLLGDSQLLGSNRLHRLLLLTMKPLFSNNKWPGLCAELVDWMNAHVGLPSIALKPMRDAQWLIKNGFVSDAIFPFRYCAVRLYIWAREAQITDATLARIFESAFTDGLSEPKLDKYFEDLLHEMECAILGDVKCAQW